MCVTVEGLVLYQTLSSYCDSLVRLIACKRKLRNRRQRFIRCEIRSVMSILRDMRELVRLEGGWRVYCLPEDLSWTRAYGPHATVVRAWTSCGPQTVKADTPEQFLRCG